MPDQSSCPNIVMSYYNVFRLSGNPAEPSWGFDLTVLPNLIMQSFAQVLNHDDTVYQQSNFLNSNFTPPGVVAPSYVDLMTGWLALGVEAHRLIGMGVTAYQDGPALANQGTLTAAQWEVARTKYYPTTHLSVANGAASRRIVRFQNGDYASYASSQHMPNAYFGESKDGCYLPLRLSHDSQKWVTDADLEYNGGAMVFNGLDIPVGDMPTGFPPYIAARVPGLSLSVPGYLSGDMVYRPLNGIWGGISARNLSTQTSFAFYVRMTVECRVTPNSMLAPQQSMSPPYDPIALASYFRISRELKDAYPADYNDLGKLWSVIKAAAKVVGPVLGAIPGPVGLVGGAITSGISAVDAIIGASRGKGSKSAPRDRPPAAASDRAKRVADAASIIRQPRPARAKKRLQRKSRK